MQISFMPQHKQIAAASKKNGEHTVKNEARIVHQPHKYFITPVFDIPSILYIEKQTALEIIQGRNTFVLLVAKDIFP